jgi:hypothetical protein
MSHAGLTKLTELHNNIKQSLYTLLGLFQIVLELVAGVAGVAGPGVQCYQIVESDNRRFPLSNAT